MFENYVGAKTQKRRKWVGMLIMVSVAAHVVLFAALLVRSFWVIEKLTPPKRDLAMLVAPPPPPPPPPPAASKKITPKTDTVKKVRAQDITQPEQKKDEPDVNIEIVEADDGVEGGVEGGVAGGIAGGVIGGTFGSIPGGVLSTAPPPPAPEKPQIVPQVAVEQQRVAGEKEISPDDATKLQMKRDGSSQLIATVKMCLSSDGNVSSLNILKSSGYAPYDQKIQAKMRQWRYKPFLVNGKPVPVCTSVTFIYRQTE